MASKGPVFLLCLVLILLGNVHCGTKKTVSLEDHENQIQFLMQARQEDQRKIQELTSRIESLSSGESIRKHTSRQAYASSGVAFTSCVSVADIHQLGAHQIVVFDSAITNEGAAYHTSTGIFTAPVDGIYVFHVSLMTSAGKRMTVELTKDGKYVDNMLTDGTGDSSWESTTELWTLKLARGSEVWIRTSGPGDVHGNCHSMWSGFLLYETESAPIG